MVDFISQPWHWSVSGVMIVVVMALLMFLGQRFGVSSSFRHVCSAAGFGKSASYFDYDWKGGMWLLTFVVGSILGGWIASSFLNNHEPVEIASSTIAHLQSMGVEAPATEQFPIELFSLSTLVSLKGVLLFVLGGFLIGFGTRYAGGCTSGHAISGLSNLQLPSLVAVIGFFIGGLLMTHVFLPMILNL